MGPEFLLGMAARFLPPAPPDNPHPETRNELRKILMVKWLEQMDQSSSPVLQANLPLCIRLLRLLPPEALEQVRTALLQMLFQVEQQVDEHFGGEQRLVTHNAAAAE